MYTSINKIKKAFNYVHIYAANCTTWAQYCIGEYNLEELVRLEVNVSKTKLLTFHDEPQTTDDV